MKLPSEMSTQELFDRITYASYHGSVFRMVLHTNSVARQAAEQLLTELAKAMPTEAIDSLPK